jgi:hypothetical protein
MNNFSGIPNDYLFLFVSETCYRFIFPQSAGKKRFKRLPYVLYSLSTISKEYKEFETHIKALAKEKGCDPDELADLKPWPDFKW